MKLHDIVFPQLTRTVAQLHGWLDKAEASAAARKFDPHVLLTARLAPDQWHFTRQLQALLLTPVRLPALLTGAAPADGTELEPTLSAIRARIDGVLAGLRAIDPARFDGAEDRVIPLPFLPGKGMRAPQYVVQFVLPNFYFHVTTAYAILRHNGVDLGKIDYIGPIDLLDV